MKTKLIIHPTELTVKQIDRMVKLGIDTLGLHSVGGHDAHIHLADMVESLKGSRMRSLIDYARSKGLKIEYELHAAGYLLPRELFGEHPEYFRLNEKGERTPDINLCASNADAMAILLDRTERLADELYGTGDDFFLWLDDASSGACHCEKCSQMTPSDSQLNILNAMLKRLRIKRPKARLAYLAYQDCIEPPVKVRPLEGIFVEYAPIGRDMSRPASEVPDDEKRRVRGLLELMPHDAAVLEYWYDNSYFSHWKKPPAKFTEHPELVRSDVAYYRSLGFENISSFACYLGDDYEELWGEAEITAFVKDALI